MQCPDLNYPRVFILLYEDPMRQQISTEGCPDPRRTTPSKHHRITPAVITTVFHKHDSQHCVRNGPKECDQMCISFSNPRPLKEGYSLVVSSHNAVQQRDR
ncbi:hypothetical protein DID88_002838 [Monilinia fructigena]|uniref:Uncharacterized protein n=1 Tax=Monilinia fructigena TaxID=38457 RepID=A0A395IN91_9HELO|nr:hypothetical protein DID88_002838 [Monilinia fructigena]